MARKLLSGSVNSEIKPVTWDADCLARPNGLRILTAGDPDAMPPNFDATALAQVPAFQAELLRGHDALAALSTKGANVVVPGTTHYIQLIKPDVVISTISQVVGETQAIGKLSGRPK